MTLETAAPADTADLRSADWATIEAAFEGGAEPDLTELDGAYRGRLVSVWGFDMVPTPLRWLIDIVFGTPLMPWRGKRFGRNASGDRTGSNIWLTMRGPDIVSFDVGDGERSLRLDYDVARNPSPLRVIRGDVRRLAPGLYLGRMAARLGDRDTPVLWFTLDNA